VVIVSFVSVPHVVRAQSAEYVITQIPFVLPVGLEFLAALLAAWLLFFLHPKIKGAKEGFGALCGGGVADLLSVQTAALCYFSEFNPVEAVKLVDVGNRIDFRLVHGVEVAGVVGNMLVVFAISVSSH